MYFVVVAFDILSVVAACVEMHTTCIGTEQNNPIWKRNKNGHCCAFVCSSTVGKDVSSNGDETNEQTAILITKAPCDSTMELHVSVCAFLCLWDNVTKQKNHINKNTHLSEIPNTTQLIFYENFFEFLVVAVCQPSFYGPCTL